ncbi:MAG: hypothetical protein GY939_10085, partial [Actinomycetia bacterium]|nr:hypothetical protein [Actinomycetes bacterium]
VPLERLYPTGLHLFTGGAALVALTTLAAACASSVEGTQAVVGQLGDATGAATTTSSISGGDVTGAISAESSLPLTTLPEPVAAAEEDETAPAAQTGPSSSVDAASANPPTTSAPAAAPNPTRPDWLGSRVLTTNADGVADAQPTPPELLNRRFPTIDTLPSPTSESFQSSVGLLSGDPLARSTWVEGCPVGVEELRYVTLTFWGFDQRPHQGELILNAAVVDDVVGAFKSLYDARYPIEEMRIATQADLDAPPTGDGNNTTAFVCRVVTGGSSFSEHAYGLAIDVNPFINPYQRGEVVLPELATAYLDRSQDYAGKITDGGVVVNAFDAIGWGWGGRWQSLDDYHHFALNNR